MNSIKLKLIVIKPFQNLISKKEDQNLSSSKITPERDKNLKSKPLIVFGFIISLSSMFLLLFTINNKFG